MVPLTAIQHGIFAIKKQTRFYPTLIKLPSDLINLLNLNVDNFKKQIVRLVCLNLLQNVSNKKLNRIVSLLKY